MRNDAEMLDHRGKVDKAATRWATRQGSSRNSMYVYLLARSVVDGNLNGQSLLSCLQNNLITTTEAREIINAKRNDPCWQKEVAETENYLNRENL